MKVEMAENGWTPIVRDIDLNLLTTEQAKEIAYLLAKHTTVWIPDQHFDGPEDQVRICSMLGKVDQVIGKPHKKHVKEGWFTKESLKVGRVTGAIDPESGEPGFFPHEELLGWHCNDTAHRDRANIVWLYGVHGTAGSVTDHLNMDMAWKNLPEDLKELARTLVSYCGYIPGKYSPVTWTDTQRELKMDLNYTCPWDVVRQNYMGEESWYFPFNQIGQFKDHSVEETKEIIEKFMPHILKEEYMLHQPWKDGDVVLMDQWHNVHQRQPFKEIKKRLLHRICFDLSNFGLHSQEYPKEIIAA